MASIKYFRIKCYLWGVLIGLSFTCTPLLAATITVNADGTGDYPTIQAAIDNAVNGDTVLVADGVYTGQGNRDINYNGKPITVKSQNGPTNCIIDASDEVTFHRCFIFDSMEESTSVLEGFTLTGGFSTTENPAYHGGGAILCWAIPTIRNCIFTGNSTDGVGGAICYQAPCSQIPVFQVKNCTFYDNVASYGGVSAIIGSGSNEINFTNCIFRNNIATESTFENFHEQVTAKCGPVITSADFTILDFDEPVLSYTESNIVADPLFADPNNGDFHLKSEYGRWDPVIQNWITDDVTSPGIDFGDPADDYSNEPLFNGNRINAGAYGNTPEASISAEDWCEVPDCEEWQAVGYPISWMSDTQCHGDADGQTEIIAKQPRRVGYNDIDILLNGFKVVYSGSPSLDGPDVDALPDTWIAADFSHSSEVIAKNTYRVGYDDINILLAWFNKPDVPTDCMTANPVSP